MHHAADELDVEVPHVEDAAAGFADDGKSFDKQIVQGFAVGYAFAEFDGLRTELVVGKRLNLRLEGVDLQNERAEPLDFTLVLRADDLGEDLTEHFVKGVRRLHDGYQPSLRENGTWT